MTRIPKFRDEQEEADFWDTHSTTDFFDEIEEIELRIVDARPKTLISLRLEARMIEQLKLLAKERGLGYQTMMRMWIMERLATELIPADTMRDTLVRNTSV
ncbi:MAG: CopG family antitoxin [Chloroflexia bacterium]